MKKLITIMTFTLFLMLFLPSLTHAENVYSHIVDPLQEYSYEDMLNDANTLQKMYPDLIRFHDIGKSVEGRNLLLIEFGNGTRKIFIDGAIHASEYISTAYLMYMIDQYSYAYKTSGTYNGFDLKKILDGVTFCMVPMVNPDGVNLVQNGPDSVLDVSAVSQIAENDSHFIDYSCWKANINGVDLNRNFDNNWYVSRPVISPASKLFKGYYPVSENETKAIVNYINTNMCWAFISFHSQGEGIYGWDDKNVACYPQLTSMVSRIVSSSGFKKLKDTSETNYGTFAGFVRETYIKPTITIELAKYIGEYPYPNEDFFSVWQPAQNICLIVADEILKMNSQEYLVFQNGVFLQGFCNKTYADIYAANYENTSVKYVKGGIEALTQCAPSYVSVVVNGKAVSFEAYNINGNNYFKLRDLAMTLNATDKQFSIDFDGTTNSISLTGGTSYLPVGGELSGKAGNANMALKTQLSIYVNNQSVMLSAYNINDYNYFKLRDLGKALDFSVFWDANLNQITIDTTSVYEE